MRFAPRYDIRVIDLIRSLDDTEQPMAETCRRVGAAAESLGMTRPSYVHLRRLIVLHRELTAAAEERRRAIRRLVRDVGTDVMSGRIPNPHWIENRISRLPPRIEPLR